MRSSKSRHRPLIINQLTKPRCNTTYQQIHDNYAVSDEKCHVQKPRDRWNHVIIVYCVILVFS